MNIDNGSILPVNPAPVKPTPLLNTAIAVVVGLMAGIGLAFILEDLDNTVKDTKELETLLALPGSHMGRKDLKRSELLP